MSRPYVQSEQAEGKIRLGLDRLAEDYPFHVRVLEQFKILCQADVATMGVTVAGDKILLLHNPAFVLDLSADELGGVLLHEVLHVVLGHLLADPTDYPDEWARIVAEEVTVNEFVKEPLPEGVITLEKVPGLPALESTGQRYHRLKNTIKRPRIVSPRDRNKSQPKVGASSRVSQQDKQDQETAKGKPQQTGKNKDSQNPLFMTADDHSVWQQARQDPELTKKAIRQAIQQAVHAVDADQIPQELQQALADLGVRTQSSSSPAAVVQELDGEDVGQLDWRRLLRMYIGQVVEVKPVFNRPPRRFPDLVGVLPGKQRRGTKPKILAVLDTSGSITPRLLELIDAELAGLARQYTVVVVECDQIIRRVYAYKTVQDVCGRGGTDLRPPLEPSFLREHRPDLVVYFTDGDGPAPERPPGPPIIWCLVPGGQLPVAWGRVIKIPNQA